MASSTFSITTMNRWYTWTSQTEQLLDIDVTNSASTSQPLTKVVLKLGTSASGQTVYTGWDSSITSTGENIGADLQLFQNNAWTSIASGTITKSVWPSGGRDPSDGTTIFNVVTDDGYKVEFPLVLPLTFSAGETKRIALKVYAGYQGTGNNFKVAVAKGAEGYAEFYSAPNDPTDIKVENFGDNSSATSGTDISSSGTPLCKEILRLSVPSSGRNGETKFRYQAKLNQSGNWGWWNSSNVFTANSYSNIDDYGVSPYNSYIKTPAINDFHHIKFRVWSWDGTNYSENSKESREIQIKLREPTVSISLGSCTVTESVTATVTANPNNPALSSSNYKYQWKKNSINIPEATNNSYITLNNSSNNYVIKTGVKATKLNYVDSNEVFSNNVTVQVEPLTDQTNTSAQWIHFTCYQDKDNKQAIEDDNITYSNQQTTQPDIPQSPSGIPILNPNGFLRITWSSFTVDKHQGLFNYYKIHLINISDNSTIVKTWNSSNDPSISFDSNNDSAFAISAIESLLSSDNYYVLKVETYNKLSDDTTLIGGSSTYSWYSRPVYYPPRPKNPEILYPENSVTRITSNKNPRLILNIENGLSDRSISNIKKVTIKGTRVNENGITIVVPNSVANFIYEYTFNLDNNQNYVIETSTSTHSAICVDFDNLLDLTFNGKNGFRFVPTIEFPSPTNNFDLDNFNEDYYLKVEIIAENEWLQSGTVSAIIKYEKLNYQNRGDRINASSLIDLANKLVTTFEAYGFTENDNGDFGHLEGNPFIEVKVSLIDANDDLNNTRGLRIKSGSLDLEPSKEILTSWMESLITKGDDPDGCGLYDTVKSYHSEYSPELDLITNKTVYENSHGTGQVIYAKDAPVNTISESFYQGNIFNMIVYVLKHML